MKLPVLKAIGTVFAFILEHWLDILRIVWAPTAVMLALSVLIMPGYTAAMTGMAGAGSSPDEAFAALSAMAPYMLGLIVVGVFTYLVSFAGLLRLVIRGEKPSLPFYLGFGVDEMRLLGTFLLTFLIFLGAYIGLGLVSIIVGGIVGAAGNGMMLAFAGVVGLAWLVAMIWLALRLSLGAPAAIGAQTIGVGPSWSMTKGNAWRLFAYWLVWCVLAAIVEILVLLVAMPGYFEMVAASARSPGDYEEMARQSAAAYDIGSPAGIARLAFGYVFGMAMMVFLVVTGGVAYRLMSDEDQVNQF